MPCFTDLAINAGGVAASTSLHAFFTRHRATLAARGVFYPDFSDAYDLPGQEAACGLVVLALRDDPAALRECLTAALAPFSPASDPAASPASGKKTLILSVPSLYRYPQAASRLLSTLAELLPGVTPRFFAAFAPPADEAAALAALTALTTGQNPATTLDGYATQPDLFDPARHLRAFPAPLACHALTAPPSPALLADQALHAFLTFAGLPATLTDDLLTSEPCPCDTDLPALPLLVARLAAALRRAAPDARLLPWLSQLPALAALKLPSLREVAVAHGLSSTPEASASAGPLRRMSPPASQPSATALITLPRPVARVLAAALTPDFADLLREALRHTPLPDPALFVLREALGGFSQVRAGDECRVDVLTLAYNHEAWIGACLESVLAQKTEFPVRHIVVDDGSHDATPAIIARYAAAHPDRITPIFLPRKIPGDNVRALFGACSAPYAALCDGDDWFCAPDKLARQVAFLESHPEAALCFHQVEARFEDGRPSRLYPTPDMLPGGERPFYTLADLIQGNLMQTNSVMYRWRFRAGLPAWFDATLVPGDWYWHLLHAETGLAGYLAGPPMAVYRRHPAALYALAEKDHVAHRAEHGLNELRLYAALDAHFKGRFHAGFFRLATGVLADFTDLFARTGDSTLLEEACALAPQFGREFLRQLNLDSPAPAGTPHP